MKMDSYLSGVFLVGASTAFAVVGLLVVRRLLHSRNLISSHDVGGYLLSVVGTMYAVILGLIVVDAMGKFQEAHQTTDRESNALADVILLSNQLPPAERSRVQTLALAYIDRVLEDEWPILDHGQFAPSARHAAIDLINAVCAFETEDQQGARDLRRRGRSGLRVLELPADPDQHRRARPPRVGVGRPDRRRDHHHRVHLLLQAGAPVDPDHHDRDGCFDDRASASTLC